MNNIMKRNGASSGTQNTQGAPTLFPGLVDGVLSRFFEDSFPGFGWTVQQRSVPVNIRETETAFELELVAPGLRKDDFQVGLEENNLTVSFEHKEEERKDSEKGYLRQEYRVQSFSRTFTLNESVDAEKISARYENGVLWLNLPKKEDRQRRSRPIEIS
jgi:HSP20 family protein